MLYIVIVAAQNCNKIYNIQVNLIMIGRGNRKRIKYKRLRKKRRFKRDNVEGNRLEKLEKANHRKKLKVRIKLKLKKLARTVNLKYQYLGE